ncbi:hypothetical protein [Undibacterium sp. TJN19]|uniref:hypothetical protein n=1 Tax=Undibacterium sp. TJN19 TaxID=3413055 RepID=UPI003BEF8433
MFIVWQGAGFTAVLVPFLFALGGNYLIDEWMGKGYYSSHSWAPAVSLAISAAVVWFIGYSLKKFPPTEHIDPKTNQIVQVFEKHTIFWIPLQYFALVLAAFSVYILLK